MNRTVDAKFYLRDGSEPNVKLKIENMEFIGRGTFGKVFKANIKEYYQDDDKCIDLNVLAIKQVPDNPNRPNRELNILKILEHPNILSLKYYYLDQEKNISYLNMVLDYIPNNLRALYCKYLDVNDSVPSIFIKVIMYQLLRGVAYLHFKGISHRDIKPLNLMVEAPRHTLKIGDFGSAKELIDGESNLTYICSRYYRAPELVFGCKNYTTKIDIWSVGCVLAELLLGRPFFVADSSIDLICEMSKILGTPTTEDLAEINPAFCKYKFPKINKVELKDKFSRKEEDLPLIDLLSKMLIFSPSRRINANTALFDCTFKNLLELAASYISKGNMSLPSFVNFTNEEMTFCPDYVNIKKSFESMLSKHSSNSSHTEEVSIPFPFLNI